jgi:hypothetical protein
LLFPPRVLEGIAEGRITLAFRRWKSSRAKVGSRHRTGIGLVEIDSVTIVRPVDISADEARAAGYEDLDSLKAELGRFEGEVYRVALHFAGPDPRVALRERADIDDEELRELKARLERFDAGAGRPWTSEVLRLLRDRPSVRAADLAQGLGRETQPFKRDVRKLKELGLTESLEVGYRLSPRGRSLLAHLEK